MHLFVRGVTPEQWAPASAALVYEVKLAQWDARAAFAAGQPLPGPAHALRTGVPVLTAGAHDCACSAPTAALLDAETRTGWVDSCGYAIVDLPPGGSDALGAPNASLSFSHAAHGGAHSTTFTPYRHNATWIVPLMRDEGVHPVSAPGRVRGATIARGLRGVWLPIHQALGFPDAAARRSAEAAGTYFVALIRAVAVVPAVGVDGEVTAQLLPAAQTMAVRLPPPSASPSPRASQSRTRTRSPTRTRTRTRTGASTRTSSRKPKRK
jgi:hypothetical protein